MRRNGLLALMVSIAAVTMFVACGNPANTTPKILEPETIKPVGASVVVNVVQIDSGNNVSGANVKVTRGRAYDLEDKTVSNALSDNEGRLLFYADVNTTMAVSVQKSGFGKTGKEFQINAGINEVTVRLTPDIGDIEGVSKKETPVAVDETTQAVATTVSMTVSRAEKSSSSSEGSASSQSSSADNLPENVVELTIPQGTQLKKDDGTVVSGPVQLAATYFEAADQQVLEAFPGGISAAVKVDGNKTEEVEFITAGYAQIQMTDENGNEIKNFSEPITLNIAMPNDFVNPTTGQVVKAGEMIPVYSFDEDLAEWTYEGEAPAKVDDQGNVFVEFTTTHLTVFTLSWNAELDTIQKCTLQINITNCTQGTHLPYMYIQQSGKITFSNVQANARCARNNPRCSASTITVSGIDSELGFVLDCSLTLENVLSSANPMTWRLTDGVNNVQLAADVIAEPCSIPPASFDIDGSGLQPIPSTTTLQATVNEMCPDGTRNNPVAGVVIEYKNSNMGLTDANGQLSVDLATATASETVRAVTSVTGRYTTTKIINAVDLSGTTQSTSFTFTLLNQFCQPATGGQGGTN